MKINMTGLSVLLVLGLLAWLLLAHKQSDAKVKMNGGFLNPYCTPGDTISGNGSFALADQIAGNPSV